jgi:hypothetical protein
MLSKTPAKRGRPVGTTGPNKLTGAWYLQLVLDALKVKDECRLWRPGTIRLAKLLRVKFPERYGYVSVDYLRQCLLLRGFPAPTRHDYDAVGYANFDSYVRWTLDGLEENMFLTVSEELISRIFLYHLLFTDDAPFLIAEMRRAGRISSKDAREMLVELRHLDRDRRRSKLFPTG